MGDTREYELNVSIETPSNPDERQVITSDSSTGAASIPVGTTAQRPSPGSNGMFRYNSSISAFEGYAAGAWGEIGGGGGGGLNYVKNPDAETGTTDTSTSSGNISLTQESYTALRGSNSFRLASGAGATTSDYWEFDLDLLDGADQNAVLKLSFWVDMVSGANYEDGDISVVLHDPGSGDEVVPSVTEIKAAKYKFEATVATADVNNYNLRFKLNVAATTRAVEIYVDDLKLGPQDIALAKPSSDWTSFSPTTSLTTNATSTGFYKRDGDDMLVVVKTSFSGSNSEGEWDITIPGGLTIDTTKLVDNTVGQQMLPGSNATFWDNTGTDPYYGFMSYRDTNEVRAYASIELDASATNLWNELRVVDTNSGDPFGIASGDYFTCFFRVPIAEWSGSSYFITPNQREYSSNSDTSNANDTTSFQYGAAGQEADYSFTASRTKRVRFLNPIQPTDHIFLEISEDQKVWTKMPAVLSGGEEIYDFKSQGANDTGVTLQFVSGSTTDVDVLWGEHRDGSTNWTATTFYWRVAKYPGVIQAAMPNAVKFQEKILSSDQTGTGTVSDLTFNNLVVGRSYRIGGQINPTAQNSGSLARAFQLSFVNGSGGTVGRMKSQTNPSDGSFEHMYFPNIIFVAADTTLTFDFATDTNMQLRGTNDKSSTYVTLEELPYHVETTDFT